MPVDGQDDDLAEALRVRPLGIVEGPESFEHLDLQPSPSLDHLIRSHQ